MKPQTRYAHIYTQPGEYIINVNNAAIPTGLEHEFEVVHNSQPSCIVVKFCQNIPKKIIDKTYLIENSDDYCGFIYSDYLSSRNGEMAEMQALSAEAIQIQIDSQTMSVQLSNVINESKKFEDQTTDLLQLSSIDMLTCVNQQYIKDIYIPDSVEVLPDGFLSDAVNLEHIYFNIDKSKPLLYKIGKNAFYKSLKTQTVSFPDKLSSIGENAFHDCVNLKSVFFGKSYCDFDKNNTFNNANIENLVVNQDLNMNVLNGGGVKIPIEEAEDIINGNLENLDLHDMRLFSATRHTHEYVYTSSHVANAAVRGINLQTKNKDLKRTKKRYEMPFYGPLYKGIMSGIENALKDIANFENPFNRYKDTFNAQSQNMRAKYVLAAENAADTDDTKMNFIQHLEYFASDPSNLNDPTLSKNEINQQIYDIINEFTSHMYSLVAPCIMSICNTASTTPAYDYNVDIDLTEDGQYTNLSSFSIEFEDTKLPTDIIGIDGKNDDNSKTIAGTITVESLCKQFQVVFKSLSLLDDKEILLLAIDFIKNGTTMKRLFNDTAIGLYQYKSLIDNEYAKPAFAARNSQLLKSVLPDGLPTDWPSGVDFTGAAIKIGLGAWSLANPSPATAASILGQWYVDTEKGGGIAAGKIDAVSAKLYHKTYHCIASEWDPYCDKPTKCEVDMDGSTGDVKTLYMTSKLEGSMITDFDVGNSAIQAVIDFVQNLSNIDLPLGHIPTAAEADADVRQKLINEIAAMDAAIKAEITQCPQ